jgi:hypothetical protein
VISINFFSRIVLLDMSLVKTIGSAGVL